MRLESNPLLKHDSITQDYNYHTTIAVPHIQTHLYIQPLIFFMINPHMINGWKNLGGTGEHGNVAIQTQLKDRVKCTKPEQLEQTEPPGQHPQHPQHSQHPQQELMNAAPTTDNLNMPDANYDHERNQRIKRRREAMRSTPIQEDKKKIIFKISINTCNNSHSKCNMFIDSRSCTQVSENEIKYRLKVEDKGRCKENVSLTNPRQLQNQTIPPCVEVTTFHFNVESILFHLVWKAYAHLVWTKSFLPTLCGRNFCFITNHLQKNQLPNYLDNIYQKSQLPNNSQTHIKNYIKSKLMNDIETNPWPGEKLRVVTINCRGLGEINKFRLLLNKAYDMMQKGSIIIMIQETMVTNSRYLDLAWNGKYVFTPGTGNSQGCITLFNNDVTISDVEHLQNRGHHFKLTDANNIQTLIVNIYAPLGYNNDKTQFFNNIMDVIANYDGHNVILRGDFNITLIERDSHRRQRTEAEKRIADNINEKIAVINLIDEFIGHNGYTWGRGATQSRIDRIFTRLPEHYNKKLEIKWTLTKSDHAAVILTLENRNKIKTKNEHIKLDNTIVTNAELLQELRQYLEEQMTQTDDMNPHMRLEFAKMTIRTKAIEINMRLRKKENNELRDINDQISRNSELMKTHTDENSLNILTRELEKCKRDRDTILQRQGESLSMKAKTRWYNEGEKSNKCFLNLLKRNNVSSEMCELNINGTITTNEGEIRKGVTEF
jgi:hypothetical protein